jgi:hypothetical protein
MMRTLVVSGGHELANQNYVIQQRIAQSIVTEIETAPRVNSRMDLHHLNSSAKNNSKAKIAKLLEMSAMNNNNQVVCDQGNRW